MYNGGNKTNSQLIILLLTIMWVTILASLMGIRLDRLEKQMARQDKIMRGYEQRTTDVLTNWNEMRKTQLTLIEMYREEHNGFQTGGK